MTLREMIQIVITRHLQENFQGIRNGAKLATITSVIGNEYSIKLLDETSGIDPNFKEVTKVKSNMELETGDKVVVVFLYQDAAQPYIIGRYE